MGTKEQLAGRVRKLGRSLTEKRTLAVRTSAVLALGGCLTRFFLAAVLANGQIFGTCAPFALSLVGASGAGGAGFAALLGACLGHLWAGGLVGGLRYAAAAILIYSVAFAFYDVKLYASPWFMPAVCAGMSGITGFVYLSEGGWTPEKAVIFLTELTLTGGCTYFYRVALPPVPPTEGQAADRRLISLLVLAGSLLVALAQVTVGSVSLGRGLALLAVLLCAWQWGPGAGAAAGVCAGVAMDLALATLPLATLVASLSGLITGLTVKQNRALAALTFSLSGTAALLWVSPGGGIVPLLPEVWLSGVAFLLLPAPLLRRLDALSPARLAPRSLFRQTHAAVGARLDGQAAAFRRLYQALRAAFPAPGANDGDPAAIFDRAAGQVCRDCAARSHCWQKDYSGTYSALNDALPKMMARGRGVATDFPAHFSARCLHFAQFLAAANQELSALLTRSQYAARLQTSRAAVCRQYDALAAALSSAAWEVSQELAPDPVLEARVARHLADRGMDAAPLVYRDAAGHLHLELSGQGLAPLAGPEEQTRLATLLGVPLRPGERRPLRGGAEALTFAQAEPLVVTAGIAARKREGQTVSGDAGTWFKNEDGVLFVLLCDGMGAGPEAAADSRLAIDLLEAFLRAGTDPESALTTLSGALALREEAAGGFTTIDLVRLDLFTGEGTVYKLGAAPTYLRRGTLVSRMTGTALPAGLGTDRPSAPDVTRFAMRPGDLAVLVSDGVTDGEEDGPLRKLIAAWTGQRPKDLALALLEAAPSGGDDRTAIVLRLENRA